MADLRPVVDSSAGGIHALMAAQVSSLGIATWRAADRPVGLPPLQQKLTVWLLCTDAGGDAAAARRQVVLETAAAPHSLVWDIDCLMHQYHLAVRSSLVHLQHIAAEMLGRQWKYCNTLAMLLHLWRDNARRVHKCWTERYPEEAKCCLRMPPKFIGGRWGSIASSEEYLLGCPSWDHAAEVLLHAACVYKPAPAQKPSRVSG